MASGQAVWFSGGVVSVGVFFGFFGARSAGAADHRRLSQPRHPPLTASGFLAATPLRVPAIASGHPLALPISITETLGILHHPIITETFTTPTSPAATARTFLFLPYFPAPIPKTSLR